MSETPPTTEQTPSEKKEEYPRLKKIVSFFEKKGEKYLENKSKEEVEQKKGAAKKLGETRVDKEESFEGIVAGRFLGGIVGMLEGAVWLGAKTAKEIIFAVDKTLLKNDVRDITKAYQQAYAWGAGRAGKGGKPR